MRRAHHCSFGRVRSLSPTATRALIANQTDAAPAGVRSVERGSR